MFFSLYCRIHMAPFSDEYLYVEVANKVCVVYIVSDIIFLMCPSWLLLLIKSILIYYSHIVVCICDITIRGILDSIFLACYAGPILAATELLWGWFDIITWNCISRIFFTGLSCLLTQSRPTCMPLMFIRFSRSFLCSIITILFTIYHLL